MIRLGDRPARPDPLFISAAWICTLAVLIAAADCVATEIWLWRLG